MTQTTLLHVGYPKTATTWLQAQLFERHPRLCTPWPTFDNRIIEEICWCPEAQFDPARVRAAFEEDAAAGRAEGKIPVISHEVLVGDPVRGLYWGDLAARRLAKVFPDARVLISIREQVGFAYSAWGEYVRRGGTMSLEHYLFRTGTECLGYRPLLPPEYLRFAGLYANYLGLLGQGAVALLPIEQLKQDPGLYVRNVLSLVGLPVWDEFDSVAIYPAVSPQALAVQRRLNRLVTVDALNIGHPKRDAISKWVQRLDRRISPDRAEAQRKRQRETVAPRLRALVAESNKELSDLSGVDLRAFNYSVG
ncbi:hypothetical protein [Parvularcula oceani]|uniref:hypothetical protein n=1 Tax=Parvularcula oceani TaxID=1247963 RepID=UPI0004E1598E|nr:hypothetical protein [Parvularcula oceani]